jgi:UDPglucose 6-dehydrogenase
MKLAVIGTGYVGLVSGTCFSDLGNQVTCIDIDQTKIDNLKKGIIPIFEPGLKELVLRNHQEGRLQFSASYESSIPGVDAIYVAVGTPQSDTGAADLTALWSVMDRIAPLLSPETVVVIKSTVPVGTNAKARARLKEKTGRD